MRLPPRIAPNAEQQYLKARAKASVVVAECRCGRELFRSPLRTVQGNPETTNAMIRQAIKKHFSEGCEQSTEAVVKVETSPGSFVG